MAARAKSNEFWWYFNGLAPYRGYSRPFVDEHERWWYCVKPGFAWPVNFFRPLDYQPRAPGNRMVLGWQFPVSDREADSRVWMNVIEDTREYDVARVQSDKRRAVRKGLKCLHVGVESPADPFVSHAAWEVWNSHVNRTGWNRVLPPEQFHASFRELSAWPGTSLLTARDPDLGNQLCSWVLARVIDEVVYIDTLASHTDRLANRPNDTIVFSALRIASQMGIPRAHYALKSNVLSLERFKESLSFVSHAFPARLKLRWPVLPALSLLSPRTLKRLRGDADWFESKVE